MYLISDMEIIAIEDNESLDVLEERLTNDKPFRTQMVNNNNFFF